MHIPDYQHFSKISSTSPGLIGNYMQIWQSCIVLWSVGGSGKGMERPKHGLSLVEYNQPFALGPFMPQRIYYNLHSPPKTTSHVGHRTDRTIQSIHPLCVFFFQRHPPQLSHSRVSRGSGLSSLGLQSYMFGPSWHPPQSTFETKVRLESYGLLL